MDPGTGCEGKGMFPCRPRGRWWEAELLLLRRRRLSYCSVLAEPDPAEICFGGCLLSGSTRPRGDLFCQNWARSWAEAAASQRDCDGIAQWQSEPCPKKLGERQPLHAGLVLAQEPRKGLLCTGCAKPELPPGGRGSLRAVVAPPGTCFSPGMGPWGSWGAKVAGMPWAQLWVLAEQRALRTG